MTAYYKIPLVSGVSDQVLTCTLSNVPLKIRVLWNERFQYFALSISDIDDTDILNNVAMVKNYPLTSRFAKSELAQGDFFFIQEKGATCCPAFDDLAVNFNLYWIDYESAGIASLPVYIYPDAALGSVWDGGLSVWDGGLSNWDR